MESTQNNKETVSVNKKQSQKHKKKATTKDRTTNMFPLGRRRTSDDVPMGKIVRVLSPFVAISDESSAAAIASLGLVALSVANCRGLPSSSRRCKLFLQERRFSQKREWRWTIA